MDESLLTIKKVSDKISFSKSYIYAMIKDEDFPKPKKWGKTSRWFNSDIERWLEQQKQMQ